VLVFRGGDLLRQKWGEVGPYVGRGRKTVEEGQGGGIGFGSGGTIVMTGEGGATGVPGMISMLWCEGVGG
jgi:hypothetical protein